MKILLVANGDFFSTYGGGQVYVKNIVDEMIRQRQAICVFSFVNKFSTVSFEKKNYKGIDLYELYTNDREVIKKLLEEVSPDIIHAHAEKALFAKISRELMIANVVTSHHGGITCPAGTLMNTKDEICKVAVNHKNCLKCVLRNTKGGLKAYSLIKYIPLKLRLSIGRFLSKLPFIYFVTPYGQASLSIEEKMQDWKTIADTVDCMIAPSNAIAENMQLNGLSKDKINVIPHGIPLGSDIKKIQQQEKNEKIRFFYIGRLGYIKGIHNLLEAFAQLDSSICELHLIGGGDENYVKKLQAQYKNSSNIVFHGKINPENVLEYIQQFDVLVHPAIYMEVFGLNISEALSQGKPVIATRCGGAEMQIQKKENGLLIEPNDVNALKEAMQWMIEHPEERERMKDQASLKVISIKEHISQLLKVYYEIKDEKACF